MLKTIISAYYCNNYDRDNVFNAVNNAVKSLGNVNEIIKPNKRILIKPNLLSAYLPEQAITTHPEVVRAVVRIVKYFGAIPIVGDSPGNLLNGIEHIWEKTGMLAMAKEENIELVNFEKFGSIEVSIQHPTIKQICVTKALIEYDAIINIPKLKTHTLMGFSCGIKNFYGVIPGTGKMEYHKLAPAPYDFSYLLSEIYRMVKEKLLFTLVDGIDGLEGNGPSLSGKKRSFNIVAASKDTVSLDVFFLSKFGFKLKDNILIKPLREKNLGNVNLKNIICVGDDISKFNFEKVKLPVTKKFINFLPRKITRFIAKCLGYFIWVAPVINNRKCVNCLQCIKHCPANTIYFVKGETEHPIVKRNNCISCFCCHELCYHKAIDIKRSFIAKFFLKNEKE